MQTSLTSLAETFDEWVAADRAVLTETDSGIVLDRLSAADARSAVVLCGGPGWRFEIEDATGMGVTPPEIAEDFGPFRVVISKPEGISGPDRLVTLTGLGARLRQDPSVPVLRIVRCSTRFDTRSLMICPFDDVEPFEGNPVTGSPRMVVRETGDIRLAPADIGPWLLADAVRQPRTDPAFRVWAAIAAPHLLRCLANEVGPDTLVLRGPPSVTLAMPPDDLLDALGADGFLGLQQAAAWVYESDRELDTRHGLFTAEVARAAVSERVAASVFARLAAPALASAKIAYGLVLSGINRDTLKALSDLRKAVTDETGKLADSTRALAGAVATTVFAGIGLVLARLKADLPAPAVALLSVVLFAYVGSVIWSGWCFVKIQRDIRSQWRPRLYSFLEPTEYAAMVGTPVEDAERGFKIAALMGGVVTGLMFLLLVFFALAGWKGSYPFRSEPARQSDIAPLPPAPLMAQPAVAPAAAPLPPTPASVPATPLRPAINAPGRRANPGHSG